MTSVEQTYTVWIERDSKTGVVTGETWSGKHPTSGFGHLHRIEGPAFICRDPVTNVALIEEWHQNGRLHRDDGPAIIRRTSDGRVKFQSWYRDGKLIPSRLRPRAPQKQRGLRPHP
jgi:hypothetical protein